MRCKRALWGQVPIGRVEEKGNESRFHKRGEDTSGIC